MFGAVFKALSFRSKLLQFHSQVCEQKLAEQGLSISHFFELDISVKDRTLVEGFAKSMGTTPQTFFRSFKQEPSAKKLA